MTPMIAVPATMVFVSIMLTIAMAAAWHSFGRPRHALIWCGAFVAATITGATHLLMASEMAGAEVLRLPIDIMGMLSWALLFGGFRHCAGAKGAVAPALLSAGPMVILLAAHGSGQSGMAAAVPPLFGAAMLVLSARAAMARPIGGMVEQAGFVMLLTFAVLVAAAGIVGLSAGAAGDPARMHIVELILVLTLPSALIGTGMFAAFLLAGDHTIRLTWLAASDPLTKALNRRGFEEAAARAVSVARRRGQPLTIIVADLDRFKAINDRYGHAVGDRALCRFVDHVAASIGAGNLLGRIGGEEFAMLLIDAEPATAIEAVERIRAGLAAVEIQTGEGATRLSASFGVTGAGGADDTLPAMLLRADEALYRSKQDGRNRVTVAPPPIPACPPPPPAAIRVHHRHRAVAG